MVNYMEEVAKMLGVEMNKDFECNESSCTYRITENGLTCNGCYGSDSLMMILNGSYTIKRGPWKPKYGEEYWLVDVQGIVGRNRYEHCFTDIVLYKLGNCYYSKLEAEINRDKWMSFYASDEVLEV